MTNTGEEIIVFHPEDGAPRIVRDVGRAAFVPLPAGQAAGTGDTVLFRYVVCGPSRREAIDRVRRLVYRVDGKRIVAPRLLDSPGMEDSEGSRGFDPFCVEVEDAVEGGSLAGPGEYGFAVIAQGVSGLRMSDLETALGDGHAEWLLAATRFRVE